MTSRLPGVDHDAIPRIDGGNGTATPTPKRHRILILPTEYPEISRPFAIQGTWAREQARALAVKHDVAVIYPTSDPASLSEFHQDGSLLTSIVAYRHWRKTWLLPSLFVTWAALRRLRFEPDCIHAHGLYPAGMIGLAMGRALKLPVVVTEHWGSLQERARQSWLMKHLLAFVLRSASAAVAVSHQLAGDMIALEPRCKPEVVSNAVGPAFFQTPIRMPKPEGRIRLLFVARLADERKGLGTLLRVLGRLRRNPPVQLTIVGDGARRGTFEELAASLPAGTVEFRGALPSDQVAIEMSACDLFVLPSWTETFGLVFAEAMAAGKPVLGCSGTAAEEIVPRFAGVLVPPNDDVALEGALRGAIDELAKYDGVAIRDYARQRFSHEAFLATMSVVYDRIAGGTPLSSENRRTP
jgi:glycosyltransferase involved in cell wall biosynthesis